MAPNMSRDDLIPQLYQRDLGYMFGGELVSAGVGTNPVGGVTLKNAYNLTEGGCGHAEGKVEGLNPKSRNSPRGKFCGRSSAGFPLRHHRLLLRDWKPAAT